ncbi:MAG: ABC transporter [Candidatus Hydrogenedentota bacterium]
MLLPVQTFEFVFRASVLALYAGICNHTRNAHRNHLPVIQVTEFQKIYRETLAVEALTFSVEPGQILGLVGPNGAGKTTTLRSIAGIIPPTSGNLLVAGHDIVNDPIAAKSKLAYVPDDPKLFDTLTVWEHLEFMAAAYRVDGWRETGNALLQRFELESKRNTLASELSRGMRQKVAICCAYLHDPRVILFDEPHTGLDPRGIRTMRESVEERVANGAAVVISSHLLEIVEDMCTHLLILHRGKRMFFGTLADARSAFGDFDGNARLEDVFFRITEGGATLGAPE